MTRIYHVLANLQTAHDYAGALARIIPGVSVECPEAIERNADFIRNQVEEIREHLAAVEAKLPAPKEVQRVA